MLRILWTAESGVSASSQLVENLSHNLSNLNTEGFKRTRSFIEELARIYPGAANLNQPQGTGAALIHKSQDWDFGNLIRTGNPLDITVRGEGLLKFIKPDGTEIYSRNGKFHVDEGGYLVNSQGFSPEQELYIGHAKEITIEKDGTVLVENEFGKEIAGEISIFKFPAPQKLRPAGGSIFEATEESGEPVSYRPGEAGAGEILAGYQEGSNVELYKEMTELIVAQRAFQLSAGFIRNADDMWGMANNMRG